MIFCPEHPKRDQNPKFTPLRETMSIPIHCIWESPPPQDYDLVPRIVILYSTYKYLLDNHTVPLQFFPDLHLGPEAVSTTKTKMKVNRNKLNFATFKGAIKS